MTVKFDLEQILRDPRFFEQLQTCAEISESDFEASFNVHGDFDKYIITETQKEERDYVIKGIDDYTGVVYDAEGKGLWVENECREIMSVHYHPIQNIACPSRSDLTILLTKGGVPLPIDISDNTAFNLIEVVGHTKDGLTTLFISQVKKNIQGHYEEIASMMHQSLENRVVDYARQELKNDIAKVPDIACEVFNAGPFIRAKVIRFRNQAEYQKHISPIANYFDFTVKTGFDF